MSKLSLYRNQSIDLLCHKKAKKKALFHNKMKFTDDIVRKRDDRRDGNTTKYRLNVAMKTRWICGRCLEGPYICLWRSLQRQNIDFNSSAVEYGVTVKALILIISIIVFSFLDSRSHYDFFVISNIYRINWSYWSSAKVHRTIDHSANDCISCVAVIPNCF